MLRLNTDQYDFEDELGAMARASVSVKAKPKKKRRLGKKIGKAFKKIGKAAAVISTGGLAAAPMIARKTKIGKKLVKKAKSALGLKAKIMGKAKPAAVKRAPAAPTPRPASRDIVRAVHKADLASCSDVDEVVKLVTAKLVALLGPPLDNANQILAKQQLQSQATYEHQTLMQDADFRRRVLELLTQKAANGNQSCERTLRVIMAR